MILDMKKSKSRLCLCRLILGTEVDLFAGKKKKVLYKMRGVCKVKIFSCQIFGILEVYSSIYAKS